MAWGRCVKDPSNAMLSIEKNDIFNTSNFVNWIRGEDVTFWMNAARIQLDVVQEDVFLHVG